MSRRRCCDCSTEGCLPIGLQLNFSGNAEGGCGFTVYVPPPWGPGDEGDVTGGWWPAIYHCSTDLSGLVGVWEVQLVDGQIYRLRYLGAMPATDWVVSGGSLCLSGTPSLGEKTATVCVVGCDGEPIPGALVKITSEDPSGPFAMPPILEDGTPPMVTGEDGCITVDMPAGIDNAATVVVTVNAPDAGYQETTFETIAGLLTAGQTFTPDPEATRTCCDLEFREGPLNPSAAPLDPRGKTLLWITSGDPGEAIKEIEVACDGYACGLSDSFANTGGAPIRTDCVGSEAPWDYWAPPTLSAGRVPMLFRCWYDGTWHAAAKVYYTQARPPHPDFGGCMGDPSMGLSDLWAWLRTDAECDPDAETKLDYPPDPVLLHPIGADTEGIPWYAGKTEAIEVTATSYTVAANNPIDITFYFPSVVRAFHGNPTVSFKIVDSITVWQPLPPP